MGDLTLPFETDDHILGAAQGQYTRYPGLPEDETRTKTLTVITRGIPSKAHFKHLEGAFGASHIAFSYTKDEVEAMRSWLPSTFYRIASLFPDLFPDLEIDPRARMLQAQTEMQTRISTVDAGYIHQRRNMGTVTSKVRAACRIGGLLEGIGIPAGVDAADFGPYTPERMDDILFQFKHAMVALYERIAWPLEAVRNVVLQERLTLEEERKFGYRYWLKELLGDNLAAIGVYGSSTQTDDPAKYDDYDNWIVVHDLQDAYAKLRATTPKYDLQASTVVNQVPEGAGDAKERFKHLGILLFPSQGDMLAQYIRFLDDSEEFRTKMKVINGQLSFPVPSALETMERGISQSYVKAKTNADGVANFLRRPDQLRNRALFEFFVKILRFNYKNAIKYHEGMLLPKEALDERLREEHGIVVPPYRDDPAYLADALLYSRQCTAHLQRTFLKDIPFKGPYFVDDLPRLRW